MQLCSFVRTGRGNVLCGTGECFLCSQGECLVRMLIKRILANPVNNFAIKSVFKLTLTKRMCVCVCVYDFQLSQCPEDYGILVPDGIVYS